MPPVRAVSGRTVKGRRAGCVFGGWRSGAAEARRARGSRQRLRAVQVLRHARGVAGPRPAPGRVGRRPQRDEPAGEDDQPADPDPRHQRRDQQAELGGEDAALVDADQPADRLLLLGDRLVGRAVGDPGDDLVEVLGSGWMTVQTSRSGPAFMPTSEVASPSNRPRTRPPEANGAADG